MLQIQRPMSGAGGATDANVLAQDENAITSVVLRRHVREPLHGSKAQKRLHDRPRRIDAPASAVQQGAVHFIAVQAH